MIVSKHSKLDGGIYDRYSASYGVFCPLINLTTFNRQANIAYISIHAAPDLYGSFIYIIYIQATFISVLLVELVLVLSICRQVVANILWGICAYIHWDDPLLRLGLPKGDNPASCSGYHRSSHRGLDGGSSHKAMLWPWRQSGQFWAAGFRDLRAGGGRGGGQGGGIACRSQSQRRAPVERRRHRNQRRHARCLGWYSSAHSSSQERTLVTAAVARFRCCGIACPGCRNGKGFKISLRHCVEDSGGDGDGGGGNAMLVMAVVMMRGGMPRRVVVMSGW